MAWEGHSAETARLAIHLPWTEEVKCAIEPSRETVDEGDVSVITAREFLQHHFHWMGHRDSAARAGWRRTAERHDRKAYVLTCTQTNQPPAKA